MPDHPEASVRESAAPAGESSLTFGWPQSVRWYRSRLLRFFAASVLGHFVAFQLFQIVTQEKVTAPERERELQILSWDRPEHRPLLQAVEAEVPLGALSHQLLPSGDSLFQRPYRSAFTDIHLPPKEPPLWKPSVKKVIPNFTPSRTLAAPEAQPRLFPGTILLSSALSQRLEKLPEIPSPPEGRLLENPRFLIGVAAGGSVQFLFLQHSSGDAQADMLAEHTIRQAPFSKGNAPTAWAEATLVWSSTP